MYPRPIVISAVRDAASITYSEEELRALLDFYETQVGARVLAKQGEFLARVHQRLSIEATKRLQSVPSSGNPFERK